MKSEGKEVVGFSARRTDLPCLFQSADPTIWTAVESPELGLMSGLHPNLSELLEAPSVMACKSKSIIALTSEDADAFWIQADFERDMHGDGTRDIYMLDYRAPRTLDDRWEFLGFDVVDCWINWQPVDLRVDAAVKPHYSVYDKKLFTDPDLANAFRLASQSFAEGNDEDYSNRYVVGVYQMVDEFGLGK